MNDREQELALLNQNNIIQQLFKDDDRANEAIHDINIRLNSLTDEISHIRMELETFKVKYDHMVDNCRNHVATLDKHDDNVNIILNNLNDIKRGLDIHSRNNEELANRITNIYTKFDSINKDVACFREFTNNFNHTKDLIKKATIGIVGTVSFLLTIQQIFFGNWHF